MLNQQRAQRHLGKNHLSSHEVQVGHVVDLSGSVTFSWRAKKIQLGATVSPTIFCFSIKKKKKWFVWYMRCLLNLLRLWMVSDSVTCNICFRDGSDLWPWRQKHSSYVCCRCKHAMLKFLLSLSFTSKDLDGPPGLHLHYGHDWPGSLEQTHDGQCERRQRDRKQSPEMENKQTNE